MNVKNTEQMRHDKAKNRQAILDTAATVLKPTNVDSISLDSIAREAGVTRVTLYNHFQSRTELLAELVRPPLEFLDRGMAELVSDPEAGLSDLAGLFNELYCRYSGVLEILDCRSLRTENEIVARHHAFVENFRIFLSRQAAGELPLGLDASVRIIAGTYVQILRVLHDESEDTAAIRSRFESIVKGVLLL